MTTKVKYISLIIIAATGFFMGERIYEDHEIKENTPTILIIPEKSDFNKDNNKDSQEISLNLIEITKELTQDVLSGSKEIGSDLEEGLQIEETTPTK